MLRTIVLPIVGIPIAVREAMGSTDTIKRNIQRQWTQHFPKNPVSLSNLIIDRDWCLTSGEPRNNFLNCKDENILAFPSDTTLCHLASSDTWYIDGTFNSAPSVFSQLYVIRAPLADSAVTCVYALLPDKRHISYERMLTVNYLKYMEAALVYPVRNRLRK